PLHVRSCQALKVCSESGAFRHARRSIALDCFLDSTQPRAQLIEFDPHLDMLRRQCTKFLPAWPEVTDDPGPFLCASQRLGSTRLQLTDERAFAMLQCQPGAMRRQAIGGFLGPQTADGDDRPCADESLQHRLESVGMRHQQYALAAGGDLANDLRDDALL